MSNPKTYISKYYLQLHTEVELKKDGEKVKRRIDFTGGQRAPRRINGRFTTTDPEIQEAIEKHPSYGTKFTLMKGKKGAQKAKPKEPEGSEKVVNKDVTTVPEAKAFLTDSEKEFGVKLSEIQNKEAILSKAKELNVEFPNLK